MLKRRKVQSRREIFSFCFDKMRQEKNVKKKTEASAFVALIENLISFQFINVWTVAIKRAASAARGISFTSGQQKKRIAPVIRPLNTAANLVLP